MKIFSGTINSLENSIKYSNIRQNAISQNIANVDTPNYKAKEVLSPSFQSELRGAMGAHRTDFRHIEFTNTNRFTAIPSVLSRTNSQYNHNGNNVDIDKEMSRLAENQIYYNALIERLNGKFNTLKTVISGGR